MARTTAFWVRGHYGSDTFYYGRGAGSRPTGVAVVSDLMRVAREIRFGSPERVSPFAHERLGEYKPLSVLEQSRPYYLRFLVEDRPGITATLAGILAKRQISLEAVLQLPCEDKHALPFVITVETRRSAGCGRRCRRWRTWISCGSRRSRCRSKAAFSKLRESASAGVTQW